MSKNTDDQSLLNLIWAKSDVGGYPHSLPGHLLDAIAVGELIWDQFMAPGFKERIDQNCDGHGREVYLLACGWHDVGKAAPSFEVQCENLTTELCKQGGLSLRLPSAGRNRGIHHSHTGRMILNQYFSSIGAPEWEWISFMLEGHHGLFQAPGVPTASLGDKGWNDLQQCLCTWVEEQVGLHITDVKGSVPARSLQLELAGFVVMADWIASCDLFPGLGLGQPVTIDGARDRACHAWEVLGLGGGWALHSETVDFHERFGIEPRPLQTAVMSMAESADHPGLLLVEAPMGEGKTEAALAAIEIMSKRFGCNGFAFAMPTQGTTDAMYDRCTQWAQRVDPSFPVALVHGKAMMNESWRKRWEEAHQTPTITGVYDDPFGLPDDFGLASVQPSFRSVVVPSDWLLYRRRALLSPGVVMTIDHLLYAGTKTKFVMLRHAGLAGKVVVIDEVHSYDLFMETFLDEMLKWLGEAGVPVILMSATLTPEQRDRMIKAYTGADETERMAKVGYPVITYATHGNEQTQSVTTTAWRSDLTVAVEVLGDSSPDTYSISHRILEDLSAGGCALAIMNTVSRAQQLARLLREVGQEVLLLHGRLTAKQRADRTAKAIDLLGKDRTRASGRPKSLVVVATQIAEQSFDVDADILYTDLAPLDLLLQRIGRLHRHDRPLNDRPDNLRTPRVVVTGVSMDETRCSYPRDFGFYPEWTLLRTAAALRQVTTWQVPGEVPTLVGQAYAEVCQWVPDGWKQQEVAAAKDHGTKQANRQRRADSYTLSWCDEQSMNPKDSPTLKNLHAMAAMSTNDEAIVVRDGEPTLEVSLVIRQEDSYYTLGGRGLGPNGERVSGSEIAREVLGDSVRVPDRDDYPKLEPLSAWNVPSLVRNQRALVLGPDLKAVVGKDLVSYDPEYGLTIVHGGAA